MSRLGSAPLFLYPQAGQTHALQNLQPMPSYFLRRTGGVRYQGRRRYLFQPLVRLLHDRGRFRRPEEYGLRGQGLGRPEEYDPRGHVPLRPNHVHALYLHLRQIQPEVHEKESLHDLVHQHPGAPHVSHRRFSSYELRLYRFWRELSMSIYWTYFPFVGREPVRCDCFFAFARRLVICQGD